MTRGTFICILCYALSLQWSEIPSALGVTVDGLLSLVLFGALWVVAALYGLRGNLPPITGLAALLSIFLVDLLISAASYIADAGVHARDVPLGILPALSLMFALLASSAFLLPSIVGALRRT